MKTTIFFFSFVPEKLARTIYCVRENNTKSMHLYNQMCRLKMTLVLIFDLN